MNKTALPFKIAIAKPCPARWEDMGGSDQVRFCGHCRKNVYNLSVMTTTEATELLGSQDGNLCARIYQRTDGTVLTEDCPVGVAQYWRRIKIFTASTVTMLLLATVNLAAAARGRNTSNINHSRGRLLTAIDDATYKIKDWAGLNPRLAMLGQVASIPLNTTPAPRPLIQSASVTPLPSAQSGPQINCNSWLTGKVAPSATPQPGLRTNSLSATAKK